jgi:hypothetical protein
MAHAVRTKWPNAKILVVEAGYVSAEIQEKLRPYLDAHILYNPDEFVGEFTGAVEILTNEGAVRTAARADASSIEEQLRKILEVRSAEQQTINERIRLLLEEESPKRSNRAVDTLYRLAVPSAAIVIVMVLAFGVLSWVNYQRAQELKEERRESLLAVSSLDKDNEFLNARRDFERLWDSYSDPGKPKGDLAPKDMDTLWNLYSTLGAKYAHVVQCGFAEICRPEHALSGARWRNLFLLES